MLVVVLALVSQRVSRPSSRVSPLPAPRPPPPEGAAPSPHTAPLPMLRRTSHSTSKVSRLPRPHSPLAHRSGACPERDAPALRGGQRQTGGGQVPHRAGRRLQGVPHSGERRRSCGVLKRRTTHLARELQDLETPLHLSAARGHLETVKYLVESAKVEVDPCNAVRLSGETLRLSSRCSTAKDRALTCLDMPGAVASCRNAERRDAVAFCVRGRQDRGGAIPRF